MMIHVSLEIRLAVSSSLSPLLVRSIKYRINDRVFSSPFWKDGTENGGTEVEAIRNGVPFEEEYQRGSQVENVPMTAYRYIR